MRSTATSAPISAVRRGFRKNWNASFLHEGMDEAWFTGNFSHVGFMMSAKENLRGRGSMTDKRSVKGLACTNARARARAE